MFGKKWENCWAWNNWFNRFNFIASGHERSWAVPMIRLLLRGYFVANLSTLMLFSLDKLWSVRRVWLWNSPSPFSDRFFFSEEKWIKKKGQKKDKRQPHLFFRSAFLLYSWRNLQFVTFFRFSDQKSSTINDIQQTTKRNMIRIHEEAGSHLVIYFQTKILIMNFY